MVATLRPKAGPARSYRFPEFQEDVLPNGIRLITAPVSKLPVVTVLVVIDAGSTNDPPGKEGVAALTAGTLLEGTTELDGAELAEKFEQLQGLFRAIRKFIWLVGTLTLLAGMLGVSNILLVTVKERTKELGVRKALGATPGSIVSLVVAEGLLLTGLAGYSAIVAGVFGLEVIGRALHEFPDAPLVQPQIDLRVALGAALVLTISAALASVVPARHAARIHPVAALRAE